MKVTVCFNSVRVVVPCGEGDLLVRDLIQKATVRYKKATAKPSQSWVTVHNLKQLDGGILDPDDRLNDVADDREQIIAIYDERHDHHGGDGTSDPSSDSENHSPDIFKISQLQNKKLKGVEHKFAPFSRNDIEITNEDINGTPPPLHVRRGSEPALNRLSPIPNTVAYLPPDPTKRWSAAPTYIIQDQNQPHNHSTPMKSHDGYHHSSYEDDNVFLYERGEGSGEEKTPSSTPLSSHQATAFTPFSRDANRLSVQVLSENGRWADAADRVLYEGRRREPLGGSASSPAHSRDPSHDESQQIILIVLSNDHGPLGIHVIPSTDRRGQDQGLLVEGVEPDGRIARDGRIQVHDRIIEINGRPLHNITFHKAQEIFKDAMQAPELCLKIIKKINQSNGLVEGEERSGVKLASTRKVPSSRPQNNIQQSNTRKIGKRVTVNLVKGPHGLGFSITTRDNHAGGEAPIYIKSILPKGAAIEDGTLRIGDRLLEVNDVEVTGRSQSEVAGLLRQIPVGGTATLAVSRQETKEINTSSVNQEGVTPENDRSSSPKLPRQLVSTQSPDSLPFLRQPSEKSGEDSLMFPWKQREILMFEIPVHDSERAGLGVSVKGKTSSGPNGSVDLGIFVKNVIHGGAASRDGRLLQNDQLVNINGISLLGKPNSESMKTLRNAMNQEGPVPGIISLTVARRIDNRERSSPSATRSGRDSASSLLTNSSGTETLGGAKSSPATPTPDQSGTNHNSENTLILGARGEKGDGNLSGSDPFDVRNPVIRQLTGNNNPLRNESYYKATHDTWNTSQLQQLVMRSEHESLNNTNNLNNVMGSPTVNLPSRDTLIIHDEYETSNYPSHGNQGTGPAASSGNFSDNPSQSDDAYTSQTSLEESGPGFSRDQLWRQSMSEKRHATLDAKNTDTYQRNKKAREERERQRQMLSAQEKLNSGTGVHGLGCQALGTNMAPTPDEAGRNRELLGVEAVDGKLVRASSDDSLASHILQRTNHSQETSQHDPITQDIGRRRPEVGPGLGMKKSSSLESLQTMVQEMALEMEDSHRLGSGRVPRGRGCNESFRAAVDRSIEAPLTGLRNKMETQGLSPEEYFDNLVAEEESESSGSGFGRGNSRQSSVNSGGEDKSKKGSKKKQGIFKGLGSMFRFGKHRKSIDNTGLQPPSLDAIEHEHGRTEVDKAEMERLAAARRQQQEEHDRMQEQYRRMLENTSRNNQPSSLGMPEDEPGPSRSERMHQLRAEHQRRHQQRKGTYPTDEVEERYETQIRQRLEPVPSEPKSEPPRHSRSHSYDVYGEGRPGSRAGYADPHKYSHYVNYEQIQQHLRKNKEQERLKKLASQQYQDFRDKQTRKQLESNNGGLLHKLEETFIHEKIIASREQREYQSQRGPRDSAREHQHRPVSNYYEYESVQAMILHAQSNSTSLPRRHHPPPPIPPPAAAVHAKGSKNMNNNQNNNGISNSFFPSSSQSHHLPMYKQPSSSVHSNHSGHQSRGHISSHIGHENIYGSSGYRPASAYGSGPHHNKPPSHHHTNSLTVPGSKV